MVKVIRSLIGIDLTRIKLAESNSYYSMKEEEQVRVIYIIYHLNQLTYEVIFF